MDLRQHTIMDESDMVRNYRFWMHYFTIREMVDILKESGFVHTEEFHDILEAKDEWNGDNISFYKTGRP
jgi:hypothetical protein